MRKVSVCVSVVQVLTSRQVDAVLVAISAVVVGSLDHAQMRGLVDGNMGLVNLATGRVQRRVVEPGAAVDDEVLRGQRVCNGAARAVALGVTAVQVRSAAGALVGAGHLLKGGSHGVAGALRGALEVLGHLVGRAVARSSSRLFGNVERVLAGGLDGLALRAAAVARDGGALGELGVLEAVEGLGGSLAVDALVEGVGGVLDGPEVGNVATLGVLHDAGRLDGKVTTVGEVKTLGNIELDFNGGLGRNFQEGSLIRLAAEDLYTLKSNIAIFSIEHVSEIYVDLSMYM